MTDWDAEAGSQAGFISVEDRDYLWHARYRTSEYLDLLQTHSDHIVLEPARRDALLAAIGQVIESHGGSFELPYSTRLLLARARRAPG